MQDIPVTVGSIWRDNKNGHLIRVVRIKNETVTAFDMTTRKKRQRPIGLKWFNKTFNKGFLFVREK